MKRLFSNPQLIVVLSMYAFKVFTGHKLGLSGKLGKKNYLPGLSA